MRTFFATGLKTFFFALREAKATIAVEIPDPFFFGFATSDRDADHTGAIRLG
jgi:hypothetical protein